MDFQHTFQRRLLMRWTAPTIGIAMYKTAGVDVEQLMSAYG